MKLLVFETSSAVGTVAVADGARIVERAIDEPRAQAREVLPLVDALLAEAGWHLAELDGIGFGRGPGSFTGARLAAAIAQGLAMSVPLPVVPVSSLAATAQRAWREHGAACSLVCIDARMGEVYSATYAIRDGLAELCGEERIGPPGEVSLAVGDSAAVAWSAVGDGFGVYSEPLETLAAGARNVLPSLAPAARDLAPLAERAFAAGETVAATDALPVYLRGANAWRRD